MGYEIARALDAPLDVLVVRKIGVPWQPELGVGAVAEGGAVYLAQQMIDVVGLSEGQVWAVVQRERGEVERRVRRFRGSRPPPNLQDRTVILVDDGIATGGTVRAAIQAIRAQIPKKVVLAVPVAAAETVAELAQSADAIVCLYTPSSLYAIGLHYDDFTQVSDEEVVELLQEVRIARGEREEGDERSKSLIDAEAVTPRVST